MLRTSRGIASLILWAAAAGLVQMACDDASDSLTGGTLGGSGRSASGSAGSDGASAGDTGASGSRAGTANASAGGLTGPAGGANASAGTSAAVGGEAGSGGTSGALPESGGAGGEPSDGGESFAGGESIGGEGGTPSGGIGAASGAGGDVPDSGGGGDGAGAPSEPGAAGAGGAVPACGDDYEVVVGGPEEPAHCESFAYDVCRDHDYPLDCIETCQSDSDCETSGTTWYAVYTCPGREQFWIGNPPPGDHHCSMVECPPDMVELSCEDTCAGNPSCIDAGETWYAHLVCGFCP